MSDHAALIEEARGHEVDEFGDTKELILCLADALEAAEARNTELEKQVQELIWEAKENG